MRIVIIGCTSMLMACIKLHAQAKQKEEIYFRIDSVFTKNDSFFVRIEAKQIELAPGQMVKSFVRYLSKIDTKPERNFQENGFGWVVSSGPQTICYISHHNQNLVSGIGDLIEVKLELPQLPYRSMFSELAFLNIEFKGSGRESVYDLKDLWLKDSPQMEDSIAKVIINDIVGTYEMLVEYGVDSSLKKPLYGSRFNGKSVMEVMRDIDKEALMGYLLFVKSYPAKYIGYDYKANETFATWVLNNAPYTKEDIQKALLPVYKNEKQLKVLLPKYKNDILSNRMLIYLSEEAIALYNDSRREQAYTLLDLTKTLANLLNDTAGKAAYHLNYAQLLHYDDNYKEAISECEHSIKYARLAKEYEFELAAMIKKAYCQYRLLLYKDAKLTLTSMDPKFREFRTFVPPFYFNTILQKRYEYMGWINDGEGDFDLALQNYAEAIKINDIINSYDSRNKNANYYSLIGSVYNNQGKPEKAWDAYMQSAKFYNGIKDYYNYAKALNNLAYTSYNLGNYREGMQMLNIAYEQLAGMEDWNEAGYSQSLMGSNYWQLGNFDSAVICHKASISLREKANNKKGQAWAWREIGDLYQYSGLKKQSLEAYDKAIELYKSINDASGMAQTYNSVGKVHYNDESFAKAAKYYELAKGVTSKTTVEALYNLGNAYWEVDKEKARKYFQECKLKSDSTGNTTYQFYSRYSLAKMLFADHKIKEGDSYFNETSELGKQLNTSFIQAKILELKGDRYKDLSVLDTALFYYNSAAKIYDSVSKEDLVWLKIKISEVQISKGTFRDSENELLHAASIARSANNNIGLGSSMRSLSFLYALLCEFDKGFQANDTAIQIFNTSGNILSLAGTYVNRGTIYKSMGEYRNSIDAMLYSDSIYIAEETPEPRGTVLNNIGVTYYNQGDYNTAMEYFERSASFLRPGVYNELYFLNRTNIAECLYYLNKKAEAEKIYLEVYPLAKKHDLNRISSAMAIILGKIYFERNELDKAGIYFQEAFNYALSSQERTKTIETYVLKGKMNVKQGKREEAIANYASAIKIAGEYKIPAGWEAFYEMGLVFYNESRFDSCISYFNTAVEMLNKYTQNVFGDEKAKKIFNNDPRKADLYFKLTYAYSRTGQQEKSFGFANLSGLAGLQELGGTQSIPGFEAESKRLDSLKMQAAALRASAEKQTGQARIEIIKQLEIAEKEYTNYLQNLVKKDIKFEKYFPAEADPNGFVKYKRHLPDDVAVVLYLLNKNNLMVFTLTSDNLSLQVDSLGTEMTNAIKAFVSLSKTPDRSGATGPLVVRSEVKDEEEDLGNVSFTEVSSMLYQLLVKNIYSKISDKKRICIIPNGILSNLPFQCLGRKEADGKFRFFIEDHAIFYTNDISIFSNSNKLIPEKSDLTSFAAFGVPDPTLKFNTREVKEIGKIIKATENIYADDRATESKAKNTLAEKKFVHFATHGVLLYSQDFSNSFLKLLPDQDQSNGNDGKLTITEVQELMLDECDLVTLSACETAVSQKLTEGWNISPANAFILRGTKSVVASLWKVDDEATSILMNEFYSNLDKKMDKVDALRMAQVKLSQNEKYAHPFYWGAFVLIGEWR